MPLILLLDANYLAHRAWHALAGMDGEAAVFGFLQEVLRLQDLFDTKLTAFAFDAGHGPRTEILPEYKQGRQRQRDEEAEEERESRRKFYLQVRRLREQYLSQAGFRNVFWQDGREADDVLASLAKSSLGDDDSAVIVSSDHDMWQCIDWRVSVYNPQTKVLLDRDSFMLKWEIEPALWSSVKALAGCGADNVPGVNGIGEVTAAKYYRGKLKPESSAFKKITGEGLDVYNRNIKLVRLPFPGTEVFKLRQDDVTQESWNALAERLGMKTLKDSVPGMPKGIKRQGEVVKRRPAVGFGF